LLSFKLEITSSRKRQVYEKLLERYQREVRKVKHKVGMIGVQNIRREIDKRGMVRTSDMKQKVEYKLVKGGVTFTSHVEYSKYLNKGIRKHVMRYLKKAKRPIPITLKTGEVIFRWASEKSFKRGSWKHPGVKKGKGFFKAGMDLTKQMMYKELAEIALKSSLPYKK